MRELKPGEVLILILGKIVLELLLFYVAPLVLWRLWQVNTLNIAALALFSMFWAICMLYRMWVRFESELS